MKNMIFFMLAMSMLLLAACSSSNGNLTMQAKIDSLQKQLNDTYKPGLGEFMSGIQVHHEKLFFAGQHGNWKLADFEIHEIMESLDDIAKYSTDRPESKLVPMLNTPLDSLNASIAKKDAAGFNKNFILLTNTCNNCHHAVNYDFNKVKIPTTPPFSNQEF